jgi:putative acetyltransferase
VSRGQRSINTLRQASEQDLPAVLQLHRAAFPAGEVEQIIQVVNELWSVTTDPTHSALHWVITTPKQTIIGHLGLSSITNQGSQMVGWIVAPLAIAPAHQGQGLGSDLVHHAISHAMSSHHPRILVYGDPAFYGRFGFDRQPAINFKPPFPLTQPMGWQGIISRGEGLHLPVDLRCHPALMHAQLW